MMGPRTRSETATSRTSRRERVGGDERRELEGGAMTELSSRDGAPAVPAPPRPPAPLARRRARARQPARRRRSGDLRDGRRCRPTTWSAAATTAASPRFTPVPGDILGGSPTTGHPTGAVASALGKPDSKQERKRRVTVRGPRRAKLVLRRVDPWSVLKFSILFSVCPADHLGRGGELAVHAAAHDARLRQHQQRAGQRDLVRPDVQGHPASTRRRPRSSDWAEIIGAVNALLFTALATLGAFALQPGGDAGRRHRGHPRRARLRPQAEQRPWDPPAPYGSLSPLPAPACAGL